MSKPNHVLVMLMIEFFESEVNNHKNARDDARRAHFAEIYNKPGNDNVTDRLRMEKYTELWICGDHAFIVLNETLIALHIIQAGY